MNEAADDAADEEDLLTPSNDAPLFPPLLVFGEVLRKVGWPSTSWMRMGVERPPSSNLVAERRRRGVKERDRWRFTLEADGKEGGRPGIILREGGQSCGEKM